MPSPGDTFEGVVVSSGEREFGIAALPLWINTREDFFPCFIPSCASLSKLTSGYEPSGTTLSLPAK